MTVTTVGMLYEEISRLKAELNEAICIIDEQRKTFERLPAEKADAQHGALRRFAALVAAAEREACAKVCDAQATEWDSDNVQLYKNYAGACSEAIRARGEKGQS